MGNKRTPGLQKINGIWHIDKKVNRRRICESTGTGELIEAEKYLARRLETMRQAEVYGVRPKRIFRDAAIKFLNENGQKKSLHCDATTLRKLDPFIGELSLESVHMGTLQLFIDSERGKVKNRTIIMGFKWFDIYLILLQLNGWMNMV